MRPTLESKNEEFEKFYEYLSQPSRESQVHLRSYHRRDFSAKLGKEKLHEKLVGKYGIGDRNDNRERLALTAES